MDNEPQQPEAPAPPPSDPGAPPWGTKPQPIPVEPLELLAGGTFTTNTPDGGDLGTGSAPITNFMPRPQRDDL